MIVPCGSPTTHLEDKNRRVYKINTVFTSLKEAYRNTRVLDLSARR